MTQAEVQLRIDRKYRGLLEEEWLRSIVARTVESENVHGPVEVSLVIVGQYSMRRLNREYRGLDEPTDVLSFAQSESRDRRRRFTLPPDGVARLGDVVVSYPQAQRQAEERGGSVEQEVALLIVHGVLHLLGYDHTKAKDARVMQDKETALLDEMFQL